MSKFCLTVHVYSIATIYGNIAFLIVSYDSFASPNCSFKEHSELYSSKFAEKDAQRNFVEHRYVFYVVATGIGPSRPAFENPSPERSCLLQELWEKQIVLWTGADLVGSCKNRRQAVSKATEYALLHNETMINLLEEAGHECFEQAK
jgi:hypothetical protein